MEFGENFVNEDGVVYNPNQGDGAVDPNNINYDEHGDVESIYDPETGKTFKNKVEPPAETEEEKIAREAAEGTKETEEEIAARGKLENETEEEKAAREAEENKPKYANNADYVLKLSGYENDEIELESGVKKISELTIEEQMSVVVQEYDNVREGRESAIAEAKEKLGEEFYENEGEKEIIAFLREKGDPVELAKYILDQSPSLVAEMSDEDAVSKQLRDDFPEYTDDDIAEEIELLKTGGRLQKRATLVRAKYKDKEVDISGLSQKLGLKNSEDIATERAEHQAKMNEFVEYAKEEKEIGGIPVNDEIRDFLVSTIVTEDPSKKTEFVKSLDDPKKLMRLKFLDTYFEKIMETTQKNFFLKGKKAGDNIIKKFRSQPVVLDGATTKEKKVVQPGSIDEIDDKKMLEAVEKEF